MIDGSNTLPVTTGPTGSDKVHSLGGERRERLRARPEPVQ
jgi:hypothetical protein